MSPHEKLSRIGAQSSKHIISARISCAQSQAHVRQSRDAIARSLRLLGDTSHMTGTE